MSIAGPAKSGQVGYALATIAVLVSLGGLGLAYGIDVMSRAARNGFSGHNGSAVVEPTIGGTTLRIPVQWLRSSDAAASGFLTRIELDLSVPLGDGEALARVGVTLTAKSKVKPSSTLLDRVYLHLFESGQVSGPAGLVGKPLRAIEGYRGETVWYDPLSADPFVAKCATPVEASASATCLRNVVLGSGIGVTYVFDAEVLSHWRTFDATMKPLLDSIGAL